MINQPLYVLLADDEENDRLLFVDALKELKTKTIVQTVNDGVELMEYLANPANTKPQLIFLDLNMPKKNGLECLKAIRANRGLSEIAVAIFSTSLSQADIEETLIQGANVYLNKPNTFDELKEALNKVVVTAHSYQNTFFNKANFLLQV